MHEVAIVTGLLLLELSWFSAMVGKARAQNGVSAPAMSGNEDFERRCRIHQNTVEQLIIFLPAMWLFAMYVHQIGAAALGLVFFAGRLMYSSAYAADPSKRAAGFLVGYAAQAILLLGGLGAAMWTYFQ